MVQVFKQGLTQSYIKTREFILHIWPKQWKNVHDLFIIDKQDMRKFQGETD